MWKTLWKVCGKSVENLPRRGMGPALGRLAGEWRGAGRLAGEWRGAGRLARSDVV